MSKTLDKQPDSQTGDDGWVHVGDAVAPLIAKIAARMEAYHKSQQKITDRQDVEGHPGAGRRERGRASPSIS